MTRNELRAEFIAAFMAGPKTQVSTPGFHDEEGGRETECVRAIVEDDFSGMSGERDLESLLLIVASLSKQDSFEGRLAKQWIQNVAERHAAYHCDDSEERMQAWKEREARADAGLLLLRMRNGTVQPVTSSKLGDLS